MLALKIILGLFGLGIVVFVHELGHFLAARLVKIDVEAFSIGWGKPILKKKIGSVEYRLGMFPMGGYCKMKGETDYNIAWENMSKGVNSEKGSYLAASPAARMLVSFGGPFFNLIFAVLLLSLLWGIGFEIYTPGNKIILSSELTPGERYPSDEAGLKTGDRIIEISGNEISYFTEIRENITLYPNKPLPVTVERDGELIQLNVKPSLDKSSGAGIIGIRDWTDPIIENIREGSPAQRAGLLPGDIITSANGVTLLNTVDFFRVMKMQPETLVFEYERNGIYKQAEFKSEDIKSLYEPMDNKPRSIESMLGFSWSIIHYQSPSLSFPAAVSKGLKETWRTLTISIKSLKLLFMGIDLTKAVSGPVRITYLMGDMAAQGFEQGLGIGLRSMIDFLALISVALGVMNLLPLPILDGGMIVLFFVELIRRKPAHPRFISVFQTCGMVIIFGLMFFAIFGDIMFFVGK